METFLTSLFSHSPAAEISIGDLLLRLLIAWLAGQAIAWMYTWSHGVMSYSQSFVQAIVLLTLVVCVIMNVVGDSLARALGLGTALAVVRFRTPVKEARDTVFLFFSVALGMITGLGFLHLATVATTALGLTALYLTRTAYGTRSGEDGTLRLRFQGGEAEADALAKVLSRYCRSWKLGKTSKDGKEGPGEVRTYDVALRDPNQGDALLRELVAIPGVDDARLLVEARAGEA